MKKRSHLPALRRFAIAITVLNILGHFFLGFEQSWAYPLVALITTYSLEFIFEYVFARQHKRTPRFIDFLLPGHITGLAVSMLLFANESLAPIVFASALAICSKILFRVNMKGRSRHFLNPSNTGIAVTLILFPWVGIAPPYQFTENISGGWDWALPVLLLCVGSILNYKFTGKIVLIIAWMAGFFIQAIVRDIFFDISLVAALVPVTGVAFLLFTFYMISDPATTPSSTRGQIFFGLAVALVYGLLMVFNIVFGLFFALLIVCVARGILISVVSNVAENKELEPSPMLTLLIRRYIL